MQSFNCIIKLSNKHKNEVHTPIGVETEVVKMLVTNKMRRVITISN